MKGTCGQEGFAKTDLEDSAKMSKGWGGGTENSDHSGS